MPDKQSTADLGVSDQELWDSANEAEATPQPEPSTPEPEPAPEPVETTGGRLKDPVTGKFVAKSPSEPTTQATQVEPVVQPEQTEPESGTEPEPVMPAQVPSWRLAEEAQRRREAEAQTQELTQALRQMQMQMAQWQQAQTPQESIDPIADPEGWQRNERAALQKEIASIRLESNLQIAQFKHGEAFDKAYEAFVDNSHRGDQATYLRVMRSPNPGEAMVQWYKERETFSKIGTDPDAWLNGELEKRMADPAFQAEVIKRFQASQGNGANPSNTRVQLPPSLTGTASAAPAVGAPEDGSDTAIWNYANSPKR